MNPRRWQNPFLDQDFANMGKVQKGMKSQSSGGARTNPWQERAVSHLHEVVFDYLFEEARKWRAGASFKAAAEGLDNVDAR
jgi:hypothetical protein